MGKKRYELVIAVDPDIDKSGVCVLSFNETANSKEPPLPCLS